MTDLGRTQHLHDRDDLMAEQVRNGGGRVMLVSVWEKLMVEGGG